MARQEHRQIMSLLCQLVPLTSFLSYYKTHYFFFFIYNVLTQRKYNASLKYQQKIKSVEWVGGSYIYHRQFVTSPRKTYAEG